MPETLRIQNSQGGLDEVTLGAEGQVLTSLGTDPITGHTQAPVFRSPSAGGTFRTFSYTQPWELAILTHYGGNDAGIGNYTAPFELSTSLGSSNRYGPASFTAAFDHPWASRV